MVRGLSQRPNLTGGPAATWDSRRSIKEEEEEENFPQFYVTTFCIELSASGKDVEL
jgi:hypothetical protein